MIGIFKVKVMDVYSYKPEFTHHIVVCDVRHPERILDKFLIPNYTKVEYERIHYDDVESIVILGDIDET